MRKIVHLLIVFMACMPAILWADDSKYLAGAVPEVDGKVVFAKEFDMPGVDQNSIYDLALNWIDGKMKENDNESRIAFVDKEKGQIVATGVTILLFSNTAFSLDRSQLSYNVVISCKPGKCTIKVERMRFIYQDKKNMAEEMIADKVALNKKKTVIYRSSKRFRIKTVDYVNDLLDSASIALKK